MDTMGTPSLCPKKIVIFQIGIYGGHNGHNDNYISNVIFREAGGYSGVRVPCMPFGGAYGRFFWFIVSRTY